MLYYDTTRNPPTTTQTRSFAFGGGVLNRAIAMRYYHAVKVRKIRKIHFQFACSVADSQSIEGIKRVKPRNKISKQVLTSRKKERIMTTKTKEEMEAERKEALENINQILDSTRPKGLGEGVSSGVSNILQGAVGAVGVAVLMPTLGLATGIKQGGILGGVVGVTVGALAGALGAAAMAVGGKK